MIENTEIYQNICIAYKKSMIVYVIQKKKRISKTISIPDLNGFKIIL